MQGLSTQGAGEAGHSAGLLAPKAKETLEKLCNLGVPPPAVNMQGYGGPV